SARRVLQIANGVDVGRFSNRAASRIRGEFDIPPRTLLIAMIARLIGTKGQDTLIRAFAGVAERYPDAMLMLVGDGPAKARYQHLAAELGVADKVLFTGYRTDVPDILAAIDVFAFTSLFEAMPYAVLEAMASGTPVVASAIGGITEIIDDGVNSFLVPAGDVAATTDRLLILAGDLPLRTAMGERAHRRIVEHYNLDQTVQQTVGVYTQMLMAGRNSLRKLIPLLLLVGDALLVNLAIFFGFLLRFGGEIPSINLLEYTQNALWITVLQVVVFKFFKLYEAERRTFFKSLIIPQATKAISLLFILIIFIRWLGQQLFDFPRSVTLIAWLISVVLITIWHLIIARTFYLPVFYRRVLIAGPREQAGQFQAAVRAKPHLNYEIIGYVNDLPAEPPGDEPGLPYLGSMNKIPKIVSEHRVDSVIAIHQNTWRSAMIEDLLDAGMHNVEVSFLPELYDMMIGKTNFQLLADIPLVTFPPRTNDGPVGWIKRLLEISLSLVLLVLTSPLFILFGLMLRGLGVSPLLCKQPRLGKQQRYFHLYRFNLDHPALTNRSPAGIIRLLLHGLTRYRLDGLPQLLNILNGTMSFIGPQAEKPELATTYMTRDSAYRQRFRVKPGVIGLAQVNNAYDTGDRITLMYDLMYIYNNSIFRDLMILRDSLRRVMRVPRF
ncbi:glycosyltransferase, partial [bacterium]|nr:glycosyltransferase [candidate division CSSED10-310 bacterium]